MLHTRIDLGTGLVRYPSNTLGRTVEENFVIGVIVEMGFKKEDILRVNPSPEDLLEICAELKTFGFSIRYQRLLEEKINDSKLPHGLYYLRRNKSQKDS